MTEEELEAIRERCRLASPGPWEWVEDHCSHPVVRSCMQPEQRAVARKVFSADDAAFIAHARVDVALLLAEIARLRQALSMLSAAALEVS